MTSQIWKTILFWNKICFKYR